MYDTHCVCCHVAIFVGQTSQGLEGLLVQIFFCSIFLLCLDWLTYKVFFAHDIRRKRSSCFPNLNPSSKSWSVLTLYLPVSNWVPGPGPPLGPSITPSFLPMVGCTHTPTHPTDSAKCFHTCPDKQGLVWHGMFTKHSQGGSGIWIIGFL